MLINSEQKYIIEFYYDKRGKSDIVEFLDDLKFKSISNKSARIQYRQVLLYLELLSKNGNSLSSDIVKHLEGDIWELRPGRNRVLYFYYRDCKFVLLHHFIKKTQKTPKKEIEKAKNEMKDYIDRKGE